MIHVEAFVSITAKEKQKRPTVATTLGCLHTAQGAFGPHFTSKRSLPSLQPVLIATACLETWKHEPSRAKLEEFTTL
jgi:hypothetical protein